MTCYQIETGAKVCIFMVFSRFEVLLVIRYAILEKGPPKHVHTERLQGDLKKKTSPFDQNPP